MNRGFGMVPDHTGIGTAYLIFSAKGRPYAVKASNVLEVAVITSITALPHTDPCILGVTKIHDTIYSVMDFRLKLSEKKSNTTFPVVSIILTYRDAKMCLVVDRVIAVVDIDDRNPMISVGDDRHVCGIVQVRDMNVALLSMNEIFDVAE